MFDRGSGRADSRHRAFFQSTGELCQVWARDNTGRLFYLADGAVDSHIRHAAHADRLTCPYPGCPDPRFIAKGGPIRRHHFAHKIASASHTAATGWRHQALLMLTDWCARRYPDIETKIDDDEGALRLSSPETGHEITLAVTYDTRRTVAEIEQLLVGHSRRLLLPRRQIAARPEQWSCSKGKLVGELIHSRGWAIAVNPQERLIATLVDTSSAIRAGLVPRHVPGEVLCIVDELDRARLDRNGLHTNASDRVDQELARLKLAAEARRKARSRKARGPRERPYEHPVANTTEVAREPTERPNRQVRGPRDRQVPLMAPAYQDAAATGLPIWVGVPPTPAHRQGGAPNAATTDFSYWHGVPATGYGAPVWVGHTRNNLRLFAVLSPEPERISASLAGTWRSRGTRVYAVDQQDAALLATKVGTDLVVTSGPPSRPADDDT